MEILTEFDELQAALAKVNMDESVFTYSRGRLIDSDSYNKTQKILNCPEMISAHKYLYELDMDQLTEEEIDKIDQLYKLGCDRGFIDDDLTKWDDDGNEEEQEEVVAVEAPANPQPKNTLFKAKVPCWTVIYSATKDGDIKTGEAYSNAVSINAAKADVNAKLSQCGYDNITILAIENCTDAPKASTDIPATTYGSTEEVSTEVSEADEDDSSDDSSSDEDTSTEDTSSDDDSSDDTDSDDSSDDSDDSSNDSSSEEDDSSSDDTDSNDSSDDSSSSEEDSNDEENASDDEDSEDSDEEDSDDSEEDSGNEDSEDSDEEDSDESDELDPNEKAELRDLYRKTFKNTLVKCKFDTSFNDLTLEQKVKFFTELSKAWKKENEPKDFMTDKEIEQLNNVVAQKSTDSSEDSNEDSDAE